MKIIIKKILNKVKKLLRRNKYKKSYAQSGEDILLDTIFNSIKKGFYVDVGAHDPYIQSNTQYFYEKGWRGINIDANAESIKKLNKKRKRDLNIEALISNSNKELDFYLYEQPGYNGCIYDKNIPSELLCSKKIKSISLTSLLDEKNIKNINFLSIDVEGHELNVLQSLDLVNIRPQIIVVESFSIDVLSDIDSEISVYLKGNDYIYFCRTITNTFYISKKFSSYRFNR